MSDDDDDEALGKVWGWIWICAFEIAAAKYEALAFARRRRRVSFFEKSHPLRALLSSLGLSNKHGGFTTSIALLYNEKN
jgi:hypothetical protein